MKRFLCLFLLLSLLLTSCETIAVQESDKNITQSFNFEDHLTISISYWNIQKLVNESEKDGILEYIEDLFNITIEPISVNWNDYKDSYKVLAATKSLPDMFANLTISSNDSNDSAGLGTLIQNGSLRSIPEDLSAYPAIEALLDQYDYLRFDDGRHYVLPRISFVDEILGSSDAAMLVRKDWMDALGIAKPSSLDDFIQMICAFAKSDPDGNGIDDTIGYNVNSRSVLGKWVILGIAPECNINTWIQTDNGFIPSYLTENFKKVVTAYRKMYEEGGLDPDFYIKKSTDAVDDFVRGSLGALEYKSSPSALLELERQWDMHQDKPFEECVSVLNIFPAEDGNCYSNTSNPFWSETLFSSSVDDEKMERILYLMEFLLSEEGMALVKYGLEGVDYTYEDGTYHCLLDVEEGSLVATLQEKYPSLLLFTSLASWGGDRSDFTPSEMTNLRYGETAVSMAEQALDWNEQNTIPILRANDFMLIPKDQTDLFNAENIENDFIRVIIGTDDPLTMWNDILDNYYASGLSDYLEAQNAKFKE